MKITFGTLILAHGTNQSESPSDLKIRMKKQVQLVPVARSETIQTYDRGNFQIEVQFSLIKHHSSSTEAIIYSLQHPVEIRRAYGDVQFIADVDDVFGFRLEGGIIQSAEATPVGRTSYHRYEFIGYGFSQIPNEFLIL
jgi:hypothetical protein